MLTFIEIDLLILIRETNVHKLSILVETFKNLISILIDCPLNTNFKSES